MQRLLHMIYPPLCIGCGAVVDQNGALCGVCWRDTPFITGLVCDGCGVPLPGTEQQGEAALRCDSCLRDPPPWRQGRAALLYRENGRRLVLALKHGARTDLAPAAAPWLMRSGAPFLRPDSMIVPVPLHRLRLLKRRYNQSALLASALGAASGATVCPDMLVRTRATPPLDGHGRSARAEILTGAISVSTMRGRSFARRKGCDCR